MDDFDREVRARVPALRRTAFLLSGDWRRADEIVRLTLLRTSTSRRARTADDPEAYLRAVLVHCWAAHDLPPAAAQPVDGPELVGALLGMPPRQRACVVLRYWEDCSVEETARLLDCSPSTVRSQTTRALRTLRGLPRRC